MFKVQGQGLMTDDQNKNQGDTAIPPAPMSNRAAFAGRWIIPLFWNGSRRGPRVFVWPGAISST